MRPGLALAALALLGLMSSHHDSANAGGKWFKHGRQGYGCGAPICSMPGCYGPGCGGCGVPACHGPFSPLVAHYYRPDYAPFVCSSSFVSPGCTGCGVPMCSQPACSGCSVPMMGCGVPACGMPMGAFDGPMYAPQQLSFDGANGAPLMSNVPLPDYYAPHSPLSAPIPSVPPPEDIAW